MRSKLLSKLVTIAVCTSTLFIFSCAENVDPEPFSSRLTSALPTYMFSSILPYDVGSIDALQMVEAEERIEFPPQAPNLPRFFEYKFSAMAIFNVNGSPGQKGNVRCQNIPLVYSQPNSFPKRYQEKWADNAGPKPSEMVYWQFDNSSSETVRDTVAMPASFGTLSFSSQLIDSTGGTIYWNNANSQGQVAISVEIIQQNAASKFHFLKLVPDNGSASISQAELASVGFDSQTMTVYFYLQRMNAKIKPYDNDQKKLLTVQMLEKLLMCTTGKTFLPD